MEAFDSDIEDPEVLASMRPPEPEQELQDGAQEPSRRFDKSLTTLTVLGSFETKFLRTSNIVAGPLGRGWNLDAVVGLRSQHDHNFGRIFLLLFRLTAKLKG